MPTKTNMKIKKEKKRKRRIQSNGWLKLCVFLMYLMYFNLQNISLEVNNIFFYLGRHFISGFPDAFLLNDYFTAWKGFAFRNRKLLE